MKNFKTISIEITNEQPGMHVLVNTTFEDGRQLQASAKLSPEAADLALTDVAVGYAVAQQLARSAQGACERGYAMPNLSDLAHGMFCAAFEASTKATA